jgi:hypothetical protein
MTKKNCFFCFDVSNETERENKKREKEREREKKRERKREREKERPHLLLLLLLANRVEAVVALAPRFVRVESLLVVLLTRVPVRTHSEPSVTSSAFASAARYCLRRFVDMSDANVCV